MPLYPFIFHHHPLLGGTWSLLRLEEGHEAKYADLFQSPGHALCPVCYCPSVSKTLSGVPWGLCGLWVWRMKCKKSTCWINCCVYFSRLILKSCDNVAEEICAASDHCWAVCVCCFFISMYSCRILIYFWCVPHKVLSHFIGLILS